MRRILSFLRLNTIRTDPPNPVELRLSDDVQQSIALAAGMNQRGVSILRISEAGLTVPCFANLDELVSVATFAAAGGVWVDAGQTVDFWYFSGIAQLSGGGELLFSNDGVNIINRIGIPSTGVVSGPPIGYIFAGGVACTCRYAQITLTVLPSYLHTIHAYKLKARGA